jgi:transcriptional regulator with XRE-family HTH domain
MIKTNTPIENIELIRKAKGMSRETVANKLGINLSTYGKIERGETGLTVERLCELATIFKMKPEDILNYNTQKKGDVNIRVEMQVLIQKMELLFKEVEKYKKKYLEPETKKKRIDRKK